MGKDRASELDRVRDEDLGMVLKEEIQKFLDILGVPRGLSQVGYTSSDVEKVRSRFTKNETGLIPEIVGRRNVATKASLGPGSDSGQGRLGHGKRAIDWYHRSIHELVIAWGEARRRIAGSVVGL